LGASPFFDFEERTVGEGVLMKNKFLMALLMLPGLLTVNLYAAENDAPGCKSHPLIPGMQGYYISGCSSDNAVADFDVQKGKATEAVHVEGKSTAILYKPQPDLKSKPAEAGLKADFGQVITKQGGALVGATPGQKWPVYKLAKDGKEYWIVLLVDGGAYFTGSYGVRVIEKK